MAADIGRRAGLAVDNAQLYGKEHEVAVALQRSMLPRVPPVPGLEVSAHYFAGCERADVGGDCTTCCRCRTARSASPSAT